MEQPWFDPMFGVWYGSIAGAVGGTLGGLLGAAAGTLAPRGKGRKFVLGGMALFIVAGVAHLAVGLAALIARQPYAIWYPFLLFGVICTVVMGPLYPVVRRRYEDAEQRRIDAEALRSS